MGRKIGLDGFEKAIAEALTEFEFTSCSAVKAAADATAKEVIADTRAKAPRKTGKYRTGWGKTVKSDNSRNYGVTVHNKTKPGLAHLLEHGHGGPQPAGAHPHITPDEKTQEIFTRNLQKEVAK